MTRVLALLMCLSLICGLGAAWAQGAQVGFGGIKADPTLPVEVSADELNVNQTDGSASFTGNSV